MTEDTNPTFDPDEGLDEVRICVYMTLTSGEIRDGWDGDYSELQGSISATLHEIIGDDGLPYSPKVFGIDVDEETVVGGSNG